MERAFRTPRISNPWMRSRCQRQNGKHLDETSENQGFATQTLKKEELKVYSVGEITNYLKNIIEKNTILQNLLVRGEISNFKHHNKKHMYFTLKDENSIIKCAMFYEHNVKLKFQPQEGMQVTIKGHIEVYRKKGVYQIIVEEMQSAGEGELFLKFLKLKEKLEKEGLFKKEHKKNIPKFSQTIGVVASLEGAVIQDVLQTIKRRFPYVNIFIYPSLVQGNEAKYQIVKGIETLNALNIDLIILARGGGSFEDLWAFNEEIVARAIFSSKVPIITGIGHETDFTIADFVADKRAHTPSAAAELAVPDVLEVTASLIHLKKRLCSNMERPLEYFRQNIYSIKNRPVFRRPLIIIEEYIQILDEKDELLKKVMLMGNELLRREVRIIESKLLALDPSAVLKRGYSITMKKDNVISSTKDINKGDVVVSLVSDGSFSSKVEDKEII